MSVFVLVRTITVACGWMVEVDARFKETFDQTFLFLLTLLPINFLPFRPKGHHLKQMGKAKTRLRYLHLHPVFVSNWLSRGQQSGLVKRKWNVPLPNKYPLKGRLKFSIPTVQLSNLADFYVYLTSISLSKINLYHGFKLWSRSARFSDDLQIWNGQIVQNGVLFHPSSCEDCFPSWNSQFRL